MSAPRLSVVIPAYNEAARIRPTLDKLQAYLRSRAPSFEILVIDDGSRDRTADEVERRGEPEVRVIRLPSNEGKGAAVRQGVAASRGDRVLITDADLAIPIEALAQFELWLDSGFDVACGSRGLPESRALTPLPFYRRRMGLTFNWMVRMLGLTDLRDTQCGFKLLRGDAAREIFSRCSVNRFAYDVEALLVARSLSCRTVEVPIPWRHVPESRVHPVYDAFRMLLDLMRIRIRAWRRPYRGRAALAGRAPTGEYRPRAQGRLPG